MRSLFLVVLLAVCAAGCDRPAPAAGAASAPARSPASASVAAPNGVDFLFAQMMVVHHAQAVRMSRDLIAKPGVAERALDVASYIARDQQGEIDEMNAWLRAWDRPAVDPAAGHRGDAAAHGMLSEQQLARIAAAPSGQATRLYLTGMIEHHTGAITMARSALEKGRNAYVRGLAKHIVDEQSAENDTMRALLDDLGQPPQS